MHTAALLCTNVANRARFGPQAVRGATWTDDACIVEFRHMERTWRFRQKKYKPIQTSKPQHKLTTTMMAPQELGWVEGHDDQRAAAHALLDENDNGNDETAGMSMDALAELAAEEERKATMLEKIAAARARSAQAQAPIDTLPPTAVATPVAGARATAAAASGAAAPPGGGSSVRPLGDPTTRQPAAVFLRGRGAGGGGQPPSKVSKVRVSPVPLSSMPAPLSGQFICTEEGDEVCEHYGVEIDENGACHVLSARAPRALGGRACARRRHHRHPSHRCGRGRSASTRGTGAVYRAARVRFAHLARDRARSGDRRGSGRSRARLVGAAASRLVTSPSRASRARRVVGVVEVEVGLRAREAPAQ